MNMMNMMNMKNKELPSFGVSNDELISLEHDLRIIKNGEPYVDDEVLMSVTDWVTVLDATSWMDEGDRIMKRHVKAWKDAQPND
jgi:hypothetical protein